MVGVVGDAYDHVVIFCYESESNRMQFRSDRLNHERNEHASLVARLRLTCPAPSPSTARSLRGGGVVAVRVGGVIKQSAVCKVSTAVGKEQQNIYAIPFLRSMNCLRHLHNDAFHNLRMGTAYQDFPPGFWI